ncbi:type III-A CRISPR-associated RAMP protein Csm3 [Fibrobacterales bacterium]|nr:type III-A CRISPR-associated RAMP protein Csm3 [Fibrobacterales bacterium]
MSKILITGKIQIKSGLHIGGDNAFSAIGAVDSPVIKDRLTNKPIIPGSSLKGKMRTLLANSIAGKDIDIKEDNNQVKLLFGDMNSKPITKSKLQFFDCPLINNETQDKKIDALGGATEVKFENTIDRNTGKAMPRQIERVIAGIEFLFRLGYVASDVANDEKEITEDFENISKAMQLLMLDYLGGGGTRGNGRIVFKDLKVENDEKLTEILKEAEEKGENLWK